MLILGSALVDVAGPRSIRVLGTVDRHGQVLIDRAAFKFFEDLWRRSGGDDDSIDVSQHDINPNPAVIHEWTSQDDGSGTFVSGDPARNLGIKVVDKAGNVKATRVLTGTLTSAAGTVAVTAASNTQDAGYSTSYTVVDDGSANVRGDITVTFPDGSQGMTSVTWIARDISSPASIPSTGGGK